MDYISVKGSVIRRYWDIARELVCSIPCNEHYANRRIDDGGVFKAYNSLFCGCYFRPIGELFSFRADCYTGVWRLNEYVGLYGRSTEIRYIKDDEEYIVGVEGE